MTQTEPLTPETLRADERPAASTSPLANLRRRREEAIEKLYVDLPVPRYGDDLALHVRYAPVPQHKVEAVNKIAAKSKDREKNIIANASILADACLGVFAEITIDGETHEISVDDEHPDEDWPKFDERLGHLLGLDGPARATDVVRRLYLTDGDIIATAAKLADWSGYTLENVEEREGN